MPFVSACCEGERCYCGAPAEHKVEETMFIDDTLPRQASLCLLNQLTIICLTNP